MNIVQTDNILSMTSTVEAGYEYVHIINKITISAEEVIHYETTDSVSSKTLTDDGYYQVTEIKLTTTPGDYYYIANDTVYDNAVEVSAETLLAANPTTEGFTRNDYDVVSTYNLSTYYINLLKSVFTKDLCGCGCMSRYERTSMDAVIMGMELIDQLTTLDQFYEVQRIIERLSTCSGLINSECDCYD